MPATITPPGASQAAEAGRVHAPQRVAQVLPRSQISAAWPVLSTAATASAFRVAVRIRTAAPDRAASRPGRCAPRWRSMLWAPIVAPSPITERPSTCEWSPIRTPARDDAAAQRAVRADLGALHDDRALDERALADRHAALEHRPPADARALGDPAAALDERRGDDPPGVLDVLLDAQVRLPHALGHAGDDRALEDVERPAQVALGRPDVEPVGRPRRSRRGRRRRAAGRPRARSRRAGRAPAGRAPSARARRRRRRCCSCRSGRAPASRRTR